MAADLLNYFPILLVGMAAAVSGIIGTYIIRQPNQAVLVRAIGFASIGLAAILALMVIYSVTVIPAP